MFSQGHAGAGPIDNYLAHKKELINAVCRSVSAPLDSEFLADYYPTAGIYERPTRLFRNMASFILKHRHEPTLPNACAQAPRLSNELRLGSTSATKAALALLSDGRKSGRPLAINRVTTLKLITGAAISVAQRQLGGEVSPRRGSDRSSRRNRPARDRRENAEVAWAETPGRRLRRDRRSR